MKTYLTIVLILATAMGKAQTPQMVADLYNSPDPDYGQSIRQGVIYNNKLVTCNGPITGNVVVTTDGTTAGTHGVVRVLAADNLYNPVLFNGLVYYIWETNTSTPGWHPMLAYTNGVNFAGTGEVNPTGDTLQLYSDAVANAYDGQALTEMGGKLYFFATENVLTTGFELYSSDGTRQGTKLVKNINPIPGEFSIGYPHQELIGKRAVGNTLFFVANDGTHGFEMWTSDGTNAGTQLLTDLNPTPGEGSNPTNFIVYNGKMVFNATATNAAKDTALWISDGTAVGTIKLMDNLFNMSDYAVMNNLLYFYAKNTLTDVEGIYVTDGTPQGTHVIVNMQLPGSYYGYFPKPAYLTAFNNKLYFSAYSAAEGQELWVSDGTTQGNTKLFKNLDGTSEHSSPTQLTVANGRLYFKAANRTSGSTKSVDIWSTDGTLSGTIKHVVPGSNALLTGPGWLDGEMMASPLIQLGNNLIFSNFYTNAQYGPPLWKLDLTHVNVKQVSTQETKLALYPNPASHMVTVNAPGIRHISVLNAVGAKVYDNYTENTNVAEIDVQALTAGIYLVEITNEQGIKLVQRFTKQ
ncbi:ELWxxDGT repeat protein [Polluticoccus soli]|uniref:ELWxxDGT repeat protein n=1 Tax=Polluticoccus soli TaxID=3034150 RepID=UPI0023E2CD19|nr:ELWxxDGT repeat protein [Flavipsychrobacter sp. JY13-12]